MGTKPRGATRLLALAAAACRGWIRAMPRQPRTTFGKARPLIVDALSTAILSMAALAAESSDPFEQRFHEGGAASHNNDPAKALDIWLDLARQGHADSQFAVGSLYGESHGTTPNIEHAAHWWRQAAEQGHAGAQFNLGALYSERLGVPRDAGEAVRLWRHTVAKCHTVAMYELGRGYRISRGVPRDFALAHTWLMTAVLNGSVAFGDDAAQVAAELSPAQLAASIEDAKAGAARCAVREYSVPKTC